MAADLHLALGQAYDLEMTSIAARDLFICLRLYSKSRKMVGGDD